MKQHFSSRILWATLSLPALAILSGCGNQDMNIPTWMGGSENRPGSTVSGERHTPPLNAQFEAKQASVMAVPAVPVAQRPIGPVDEQMAQAQPPAPAPAMQVNTPAAPTAGVVPPSEMPVVPSTPNHAANEEHGPEETAADPVSDFFHRIFGGGPAPSTPAPVNNERKKLPDNPQYVPSAPPPSSTLPPPSLLDKSDTEGAGPVTPLASAPVVSQPTFAPQPQPVSPPPAPAPPPVTPSPQPQSAAAPNYVPVPAYAFVPYHSVPAAQPAPQPVSPPPAPMPEPHTDTAPSPAPTAPAPDNTPPPPPPPASDNVAPPPAPVPQSDNTPSSPAPAQDSSNTPSPDNGRVVYQETVTPQKIEEGNEEHHRSFFSWLTGDDPPPTANEAADKAEADKTGYPPLSSVPDAPQQLNAVKATETEKQQDLQNEHSMATQEQQNLNSEPSSDNSALPSQPASGATSQ